MFEPSWLCDIAVKVADTQSHALSLCPEGYERVDQDLCAHTKKHGNWVYLFFKRTKTTGDAVTHIILERFNGSQSVNSFIDGDGRRYNRILADLNSGAGGPYIYVSFTKDPFPGRPPVCGIRPHTGPDVTRPSLPPNWEYVCWRGTGEPADTNSGAGGWYIWLSMGKEYNGRK
jgi:hypothetical protein